MDRVEWWSGGRDRSRKFALGRRKKSRTKKGSIGRKKEEKEEDGGGEIFRGMALGGGDGHFLLSRDYEKTFGREILAKKRSHSLGGIFNIGFVMVILFR